MRLDVAHLYLLVLTIPHRKDGWVSVPPGIFTPSCKLVLIYSYSWFLLFAHKMLTCPPGISWSCLNPLNYRSVLTQRYAFKHLIDTPFKFSNHALRKNWTSQPAITPRNTSRLNILIFPPTWQSSWWPMLKFHEFRVWLKHVENTPQMTKTHAKCIVCICKALFVDCIHCKGKLLWQDPALGPQALPKSSAASLASSSSWRFKRLQLF